MFKIRIFHCALLLSIMMYGLIPARASTTQKTVRVGIYQNHPKVFMSPQGKPGGIFIDILQAVAKEENWTLEFVNGTWSEGLARLTNGEIDLMPDVSFSKERTQRWAFTREAVLSDWFQVICPESKPVRSILDLSGKRIAVLQNSVQEESLASTAHDFGFEADIFPMPDYDTGARMLRQDKVDVLIANRYLAVEMEKIPELEASPVIYHPTRLHFAAPLQGRQDLLAAIDFYLMTWKSDRSSIYYQTLKHWTGETPETAIPAYIKTVSAAVAVLIILISSAALILRWQVQKRTAELRKQTLELETALHQLEETQNKAIQQERLHALGQMASGIAHDFNNILTPIIGLSEVLLLYPERLKNHALVKKNLENIAQAGQDGSEIVKRMKDFYRTSGHEKSREIDPCDAVDKVVELSRPLWTQSGNDGSRHIDVQTELTRGLFILVQETELREALMNLLGNANDAISETGTVTITVKQEKRSVIISVKDTGTGMTEDVKKKCLSAFYTTKGQNGTGIGLAMVKNFCDNSNASIRIDSSEGKGTVISMIFPLHSTDTTLRQPADGPPEQIRPLDILIVDDEPRALESLKMILSQNHHRITTVDEPGKALKKACAHSFDLIVTDRHMPGLSGEELARSIRSLPDAPPVILLTGTPSQSEIVKQEKVHVLHKPLSIRQLNRLLADLGFGK